MYKGLTSDSGRNTGNNFLFSQRDVSHHQDGCAWVWACALLCLSMSMFMCMCVRQAAKDGKCRKKKLITEVAQHSCCLLPMQFVKFYISSANFPIVREYFLTLFIIVFQTRTVGRMLQSCGCHIVRIVLNNVIIYFSHMFCSFYCLTRLHLSMLFSVIFRISPFFFLQNIVLMGTFIWNV